MQVQTSGVFAGCIQITVSQALHKKMPSVAQVTELELLRTVISSCPTRFFVQNPYGVKHLWFPVPITELSANQAKTAKCSLHKFSLRVSQWASLPPYA